MTEYNRRNPYQAVITEKKLLSRPGSTRATYHIRLDIANSGLQYKVGDAIGIFPDNPKDEVDQVIDLIQADPQHEVRDPKTQNTSSLRYFLTKKANLAKVTLAFLKGIEPHTQYRKIQELIDDKDKRHNYCSMRHIICALTELKPSGLSPEHFVTLLSPMMPRFYSIASSHTDFIDLLVATFTYSHNGRELPGLGSDFLCHKATPQETYIPLYVQPTAHFTLPENDAPIIMIGPGTGIAPFRAFLQKRAAGTRNWLFFGERNKDHDFYYQDELQTYEKENHIRLTTAFSRDQESKVYVQDRMQEHADDLWQWLQEGALLYVCGDAKHMAKSVNEMLHAIACEKGNLSEIEARNYVKSLRKEKRYLLDVY